MRYVNASLLIPCFVYACSGTPNPPGGSAGRDTGPSATDTGTGIVLDAGLLLDVGPDAAVDAGLIDGGRPDAMPVDSGADAGPADTGVPANPCDLGLGVSEVELFDQLLVCLRDPTASPEVQRGTRDEFVRRVNGLGGFPIIQPNSVTFLYVNDPSFDVEDDAHAAEDYDPNSRIQPLRVAGAFNMWDPEGGLVMQPEAQDVFHVTVPLTPLNYERWGYKFVAKDQAGADIWFSDPMSKRFDYDPNGRLSLVTGGSDLGHLELLRDVQATQLSNTRDIYVYLPRGYETSAETYSVLYMHDGNNIFSPSQPNSAPASWQADEVIQAEISGGRVTPFIIVGVPNNGDRRSEYTHIPDDTGSGLTGGDASAYGDFIVSDLKPLIDTTYRTQPGRESTGIMGSSLGGLVSFAIGLQHPNIFRFVGGMSSTFGWGRFGTNGPDMVQTYAMAPNLLGQDQVFYLDSGGGAPSGGCTTSPGSGSDNYCSTVRMRDTLVAAGIATFPDEPDATALTPATIDIMHWWTPDAPHNEAAWNARLHRAFRLFSRP